MMFTHDVLNCLQWVMPLLKIAEQLDANKQPKPKLNSSVLMNHVHAFLNLNWHSPMAIINPVQLGRWCCKITPAQRCHTKILPMWSATSFFLLWCTAFARNGVALTRTTEGPPWRKWMRNAVSFLTHAPERNKENILENCLAMTFQVNLARF